MAEVEVYLEVEDGIIIGYHDYEVDKDVLPKGTKFVKFTSDNPDLLMGLEEKYINEDIKEVKKASEEYLKVNRPSEIDICFGKLRALYLDIKLKEELGDTTDELEKEFEKLKKEYKLLKKDPVLKVNAGRSRTITLPNNKINLGGTITPERGEIVSVKWTKKKGSTAAIDKPNSLSTKVTGLKKGLYEFELTVITSNDKKLSDIVKVTVKEEDKDNHEEQR